jgi:hypothetical protein
VGDDGYPHAAVRRGVRFPIPLDSRNARGGNQFLREPRLPFAVFASNANEMCGPTNAASVPVNERRKLFLNPGKYMLSSPSIGRH